MSLLFGRRSRLGNNRGNRPAYDRDVSSAVKAFTSKIQTAVKSENKAEEIGAAVSELINAIKP